MYAMCEVLAKRQERIEALRARREIVAAIKEADTDYEAELIALSQQYGRAT
jgi:hypothetical protein